MEKHLLSKSTFMRAVQCEKSLYLHKKRPFLRDKLSAEQRAKFQRGTRVGEIARELFPGGVNLASKSPSQYQQAVANTAKAIEQGQEVIYEASFQHDRVLVILDILVKNGNKYQAYEVKSSAKVSATYVTDAALQYYVITNAGVELEDISLVHINTAYKRAEKLVPGELFSIMSVKQQVEEMQGEIADKIGSAKEVLKLRKSPKTDIGPHCFDPYPCDFIGHCWKNVKENSVFELLHLPRKEQFANFEAGRQYVSDLDPKQLDKPGRLEIQAFIENKPHYNWKRINHIRMALKDEYYILKVVFIKPAVPVQLNANPYMLMPAMAVAVNHRGRTVFDWQLDSGKHDFNAFDAFTEKLRMEGKTIFIFNEDEQQEEFIRMKTGSHLINLFGLFKSLDYMDARLHGKITPLQISDMLLDENPFKNKEIPGQQVASVLMEKALYDPVEHRNGTAFENVRQYAQEFVAFNQLLLKHIMEIL